MHLLLLIHFTATVMIRCHYQDYDFFILKSAYICSIQNKLNIESKSLAVIDSSYGEHRTKMSNDDVIAVYCPPNKNIQYFPKNLQNVFKNLKVISIGNNNVKEVHKEDLRPFPNLVELFLHENKIEILEEGLFEHNLELQNIYLRSNTIFHIAENIFDDLVKLNFLVLQLNPCIDMRADNNRTGVLGIIKSVKNQCVSKDFKVLSTELKELEDNVRTLNLSSSLKFFEKISDYEIRFKNSKYANFISFNARITNLQDIKVSAIWIIKDQINTIEKIIKHSDKSITDKLTSIIEEQTKKISKLETILLKFINKSSTEFGNLRYDLDQKYQVHNYKIDKSSELHDNWKASLIIGCFCLGLIVILLTFKRYILIPF